MDETDIAIINTLLINSRTTYRDIAEKVELTVPTVYKRVQSLIDEGIIKQFTTKLSIGYLGAVQVHFIGDGNIRDLKGLSDIFSEDDNTSVLHVGSNDYLHVGGLLHDLSELDSYTNYIKEKTGMNVEHLGIMSQSEYYKYRSKDAKKKDKRRENLSKTDKKVIGSLYGDSRKTISDIAEEVGLSAKTVKNSIIKLLDNNVVEFSIDWNPSYSGDIVPFVHIYIKEGIDKTEVYKKLENDYSGNLIFNFMFHNISSLIVSTGWVKSLGELESLKEKLESEKEIEKIVPNLIYSGHHFKTWIDNKMEDILSEM